MQCARYTFPAMPTKSAFVIMPFSPTVTEDAWDGIYDHVFKPTLERCGYSCTRAETSMGSLIASIVEDLIEADLVIADVTDRNANVFYELGVRHALRRGTIIVSRGPDHVPSDLKGYWFLTYGIKPAEVAKFGTDISRIVRTFEEQPERSDSPVSDYLEREQISSSRQVNRDNVKKLGALLTELSGNRLAIRQFVNTRKPQVFSLGCLGLLIQTLYVDVGPDALKLCYELEYKLQLLQKDIYPEQMVVVASQQIEILAQRIGEIKDKIGKGDFTEPTTVSSMLWSPRETVSRGDMSQRCAPSSEVSTEHPPDNWEEYNYSYSGPQCAACSDSGTAPCTTCGGSGTNCLTCNGTGSQPCPQCGVRH